MNLLDGVEFALSCILDAARRAKRGAGNARQHQPLTQSLEGDEIYYIPFQSPSHPFVW